jgi:glycosyltransferase involved in cell wall biosynthesis
MAVSFGKDMTPITNERHRPANAATTGGAIDILLASGTPHLPQVMGGLQVNTNDLALELNARGISTAVLTRLSLKDRFGLRSFFLAGLAPEAVLRDRSLGYDVFRSRCPWGELDGLGLPEVVVVQNGRMLDIAAHFARRGVPTVAYFHGLEFESSVPPWLKGRDLPFRAFIANSGFTAERVERRLGVRSTIIPPLFRSKQYRVNSDRRFVTFVNPVAEKGVQKAMEIAALCPELPFRFVKAWHLSPKDAALLEWKLRELPNVSLVERTTDMRSVYRDTKILLVPSQWLETWGRVATEVQYSGIPVLASRSGALPEAVGPGGILIEPTAPAQIWAEELKRIWHDKDFYEDLSAAATEYSERPQIDPDRQIEALLSVLRGVTGEGLTAC